MKFFRLSVTERDILVSILLIVELAFEGGFYGAMWALNLFVSILLIVELAFEGGINGVNFALIAVSILLIVELAFEDICIRSGLL